MAKATRYSLQQFIRSEASGGIILLVATVLALIVANSPLSPSYLYVQHIRFLGLSLLHWVNDGLMALFFLLVGLEVKREFLIGELSSWGQRILPGAAAVMGMAVPAAIFIAFNLASPEQLRGWAVPAATDIAFALGILALLGSRVPASLKVLLTAIAVIDDLLAILIIAIFYTSEIAIVPLVCAFAGLAVLVGLNRAGVRSLFPYLVIGLAVWVGVLLSGVHATLAGVAVAMTIPLRVKASEPPLEKLEHGLHPWVTFAIVPIFAFANAGLAFGGMTLADAVSPLPLGAGLGLFLGKQIGIAATIFALIRLKLAPAPVGASSSQIYGMAILCGIGFTMSLFIGGLAFSGSELLMDEVKIGVFTGSILSGAIGWLVLRWAAKA